MDDDTPIWLLDVDGVLNVITRVCPDSFKTGRACPGGADDFKYTITWDPAVIEMINDIHTAELARVMWLTTWGSGANGELRALLGMDELEVADEPPLYRRGYGEWAGYSPPPGGWWKLATVMRLHEENPTRRIVWTDDDIALEPAAQDWVKSKPIMTVAPYSAVGLTVRDLNEVRTYLTGGMPHSMHRQHTQAPMIM